MIDGKTILAIIPARGGSKRLPKKNIMQLSGKPLIGWSIEAAQKSKYVDRLIISTDDEEVIKVAKLFNCEVPFIRPVELAGDNSKTIDVVCHALNTVSEKYDIVILLQPTSPFRSASDIDNALVLFSNSNSQALVSACSTEHPPEWSFKLKSNLRLGNEFKKFTSNKRSQDFQKSYRLNGAIYIASIKRLLKDRSFFNSGTIIYAMSPYKSIDIDKEIDFLFSDFLLNQHIKQ